MFLNTPASPVSRKNDRTRRLFFALLPDRSTREKLVIVQKNMPGRKTPPENLHLTLFFLGNQPDRLLPSLESFMDQLTFTPFGLSLDKTGHFAKIRLSWIGPTYIPPELHQLHKTIHRFLVPAYLKEKKESFRPHVTLARQSPPSGPAPVNPIVWRVDRLALMESILSNEPGRHPGYRILYEKMARV